MAARLRMFRSAPLLLSLLSCGLTSALAQTAPVRLAIMPSESTASNGFAPSAAISFALLAQALRLANYQVASVPSFASISSGTVSSPLPPAETSLVSASAQKLGIRASVVTQTRFTQRGGKSHFFGAEQPVVSTATTEYLVLLEVITLSDGQVMCVSEGKATFRGSPGASGTGTDFAPPIPPSGGDSAVAVTSAPSAPPATGQSPQNSPSHLPQNPALPFPQSGTPPYGVPFGTSTGGNAPYSPQVQYGYGSGTVDPSIGQAALRIAVQNAVMSLPRLLLSRCVQQSGDSFRVLDIDGANVVLSAGSERGLHVGDTVTVQRTHRMVTLPETGKEIAVGFRTVATLEITQIEADHCEAVQRSGSPLQRVGSREKERFLVARKEVQAPPAPSELGNPPSPAVSAASPPAFPVVSSLAATPVKRVSSRQSPKHHRVASP